MLLGDGFSKLSRKMRFQRLIDAGILTEEDMVFLSTGGVQTPELAARLIENEIGYFQLPMGVATHFVIDGRELVIPLAVEETSIIAALSKTAKWIKQHGEITTASEGDCITGQIQCARVNDFEKFARVFHAHRAQWIHAANTDIAASMVARGGGVVDMQLRSIVRPDGGIMAIIHLNMNSCDAMGANIINQVLEYLKTPIESLTGERVSMCILSNLNDQKITTACVVLRNVEADLGKRFEEASLFAELDPYRAATHNKGVMNGIDPVVIATGNDWRAIEAGVHAYAARTGHYQAITRWRYAEGVLTGKLCAPLVVGTVGGVTNLHPTAGLALRMMGITSANQLSRVIAAVGLVQNLGALRALCTDGITAGHMKLHIDNLLLSAGASPSEMSLLKPQLEAWLVTHRHISLSNVTELLQALRQQPSLV